MRIQVRIGAIAAILAICLDPQFVEGGPTVSKRIINGSYAKPAQFPYQVFLRVVDIETDYKFCGGVIVSKRIILSAAYCFMADVTEVHIHMGGLNVTNVLETGQQFLTVPKEYIIIHDSFDDFYFLNDIALIKLPTELRFDRYVSAISLPKPREDFNMQWGMASGWGATKIPVEGAWQPILRCAELYIISNMRCQKLLPIIPIEDSHICVDPSEKNICFGDIGGPLVVDAAGGDAGVLVGIASYIGDEKCSTHRPSIFTRISAHLDWIKRTAGEEYLKLD